MTGTCLRPQLIGILDSGASKSMSHIAASFVDAALQLYSAKFLALAKEAIALKVVFRTSWLSKSSLWPHESKHQGFDNHFFVEVSGQSHSLTRSIVMVSDAVTCKESSSLV